MSSPARTFGLTLLLLGVFLGGALALQWWLGKETRRLLAESVQFRHAQLEQVLEQLRPAGGSLDPATLPAWGGALGGRLTVAHAGSDSPKLDNGSLLTECPLPGQPGLVARLVFTPPSTQRLSTLHLQAMALTILLALLLLVVPTVLAFTNRPAIDAGATRSPWRQASSAMSGLTEMARLSVERGEKLAEESGARRRAEEDLQTSRSLLDQSQGERVRLGRELHDNICQTLFAVSLTLESVAKKLRDSPESATRLNQSITELRRLNQEVRAYLSELEPAEIRRQSFHEAVDRMLATLPGDSGIRFVRQVDDEIAALIPPDQILHTASILREALSNALRHGSARTITLRAERDERTVALVVQDDGAGFDPGRHSGGHGLANMQARAAELGAVLRVESSPGKGTRILLLLPLASVT